MSVANAAVFHIPKCHFSLYWIEIRATAHPLLAEGVTASHCPDGLPVALLFGWEILALFKYEIAQHRNDLI